MAFKSYLTYNEYIELGGTVPEGSFKNLERKAQRMLDYITFDRIKNLTRIPDEVKEVLTEFVNLSYVYDNQTENGDTITSYSNGIEKLTYRRKTEKEQAQELKKIAYRFLPEFLVTRSVGFDVEEYLQSDDNYS